MARSVFNKVIPVAVVIALIAFEGTIGQTSSKNNDANPSSRTNKVLQVSSETNKGADRASRPLFGGGANGGVSGFLGTNGLGQALAGAGAAFGAGLGGIMGSTANMVASPIAAIGPLFGMGGARPPVPPPPPPPQQMPAYPGPSPPPPMNYQPPYYPFSQPTTNNVGMVGWGSYGANTGTLSYNQCNSLWKDAILKEATNYDDWRCSARLQSDGSAQPCVLTGAIGTSPPTAVITTGCGWTMPLFCDDSINDIVYGLRATSGTPATITPAPTGFTYVAGAGYYKIHTELKTWAEAKTLCEADYPGAHLAVPSTANDYSSILTLMNAGITGQSSAWVGLNDIAQEGFFQTVKGQPLCTLGQAVFVTGQPDNGGTSGPVQNCLQLTMGTAAQLDDMPCGTTLPFVCEVTLPQRLATCRTA